MTDRDTFAAAALTGLLAAPTDKDRSSEYWARFSYELADAMLRERDKTNHDAAPAARATTNPGGLNSGSASGTSGEQSPVTKRDCGTGDTKEPVAWIAWFDDEDTPDADFLFSTKEKADCWCCTRGADPVPLYRHPQPALTDEEWEAVEHFAATFKGPMALKLRKLLERTK